MSPDIAAALNRFDFVHAIPLRAMYDDADAMSVDDHQWLADAGRAGWCGVTQDSSMLSKPINHEAIVRARTHVFSLARQDWSRYTQGVVLGRNVLRFRRRARRADGCFWRISEREPLKDIP